MLNVDVCQTAPSRSREGAFFVWDGFLAVEADALSAGVGKAAYAL